MLWPLTLSHQQAKNPDSRPLELLAASPASRRSTMDESG
jgi:hypothetical protein